MERDRWSEMACSIRDSDCTNWSSRFSSLKLDSYASVEMRWINCVILDVLGLLGYDWFDKSFATCAVQKTDVLNVWFDYFPFPLDVFRVAKPHGAFFALLGTYTVSALLHGLNFQLGAVLLSLGFYTYTEHVTRRKLSQVFSACIQARKCGANCDHSWKENNWMVKLSNLFMSLLAMFHLAYLGLMFDSSQLQEEGYSYYHVLAKWRWLNFSSHWITAATFLFYLLIWERIWHGTSSLECYCIIPSVSICWRIFTRLKFCNASIFTTEDIYLKNRINKPFLPHSVAYSVDCFQFIENY